MSNRSQSSASNSNGSDLEDRPVEGTAPVSSLRLYIILSFAVGISCLLAAVGLSFFRMHFTADDYGALAACSPLADLDSGAKKNCWNLLGPVFSRIPAAVLIQYQLLKFHIWERFRFLTLFGFFAVHSLSFGLLVGGLAKLIPRGNCVGLDKFMDWGAEGPAAICRGKLASFLCIWGVAILTLFPNNHEIHLFYSTAVHSFGALAVAGGFFVERPAIRFFLYGLGGLFYETFLLLTLGLEGLRALLSARRGTPWLVATLKSLVWTLLVILAVFLIRHQLAELIGGSNARELSLGGGFFQRWVGYEKMLLLLNFRKDNWPSGGLEWLGIFFAMLVPFMMLRQQSPKSRGTEGVPFDLDQGPMLAWIAGLVLFPVGVATPLALLPYSAIRALYGPNLIRQLGLVLLLLIAIASAFSSRPRSEQVALAPARSIALLFPKMMIFLSLTCITVSYGFQWVRILKIKSSNSQKLDRLEMQTRDQLKACQSPCILEVPRPDEGLEPDWVIHEDYFPAYFERLRLLETPEKKVQFRIQPQRPGAS